LTLTRNEFWHHQYRQRRYLEHASDDELRQRLADLLNNVCYLTEANKIGVVHGADDAAWWGLLTELFEEHEQRGKGIPPIRDLGSMHFAKLRYNHVTRAAEVWRQYGLIGGDYLFKFGKRKHLEPMISDGAFRLSPATYYSDESLQPSIRDSELEFTQELYGAKVRAPRNRDYSIPPQQWESIPAIGNLCVTVRSDRDYYVACFAGRYEYRLFDDFDADACVVIRDPTRFIERLGGAVRSALNWNDFLGGSVEYRDPYHPSRAIGVFFTKHFRYAYQKEFRLVWLPPEKQPTLQALNLCLGPLTSFCDILVL
jgi:hypothetical protein